MFLMSVCVGVKNAEPEKRNIKKKREKLVEKEKQKKLKDADLKEEEELAKDKLHISSFNVARPYTSWTHPPF